MKERPSAIESGLSEGRQSRAEAMRGLTILELLVVLALLIAIGAMVAPAMVGVVEDRALASTADTLQQQLILARAHAQSSGRPVEVAYRTEPGSPRIIARYFQGGERGTAEGDQRAAVLRGEDDPFAGSETRQRLGGMNGHDEDALSWNWARQPVPRGIRVARNSPENGVAELGQERHEGFLAAVAERTSADAQSAGPIRIAVFLPDGSSLLGTPVWLTNERGRSLRLEVSVWTGLPRLMESHEAMVERNGLGNNGRLTW